MEIKEFEDFGKEIKNDITKANELTKGEFKNEITEVKSDLQGKLDALQAQYDRLSVKQIDLATSALDFKSELKNTLSSTNEDLLAKGYKFTVKATMTPAIAPEQISGISNYANRKINVRDLMSIGATSQNAVNYVQEQSWTSFTGTTTEGSKRPQSGFDLVATVANVKTVGTFLKVTKEALADVDGISSYIANRAPAKLKEVEDKLILDILKPSAQPFSGTTLTFGTGFTANEYDVLRVAVQMVAKENYSATGILISPTDKARLELAKDAQGGYLFPSGNMSVAGVPVVESTCIAEGDFLVADWKLAAEIKQREGLSINFYNQNATDVEDGLVTIGLEERFAIPVYNPKAFVSGSFAAAKAKLKS